MRIDQFLKISRLVKRRTVANELCDAGKVKLNGQVVRASHIVKVGDLLDIEWDRSRRKARILALPEGQQAKADAAKLFTLLEETRIDPLEF